MAAALVGGAFLSATLQVAFDRLASSEILDYFRGRKLKDSLLKKLRIILVSINQVLEDAEERQYRNSNVKQWLDELKDAVFKAEDLLDEIATEASRQKLDAEFQTTTSKVRGFFPGFVSPFDKEIESRIQQVLGDLEFLGKQKDVLGLKDGSRVGSEVGVGRNLSERLPTTSLINESNIYGRDVDKEKIIQILLSHNMSSEQLTVDVITIMGMGGMGKTTLAQLVYNDERVDDQFQLKAWVSVSEEFNVIQLTKVILLALKCSTKDSDDLNLHQLELKERLMGKKFFLVLDDVWNENHTSWETLQAPYNYGSPGSKILVTTRNKKVALVMHSAHIHLLKPLEDKDCWKLFAKYAFNDHFNGTYSNLVSIGRKITKKCGGLPLAIKTLGSLLHTKPSHQEWVKILESDIWHLAEDDNNIIPALRLSYHYLPSNLKRCFAYCSIFPKDYMIDKEVLIQLWAAEGFLHSCQKGQSIEEVGIVLFNDLESRSFFEPSWQNYFIMHDLINDLAKSVMGEFCFRLEGDYAQDIPLKARYFSHSVTFDLKLINYEPIFKCNQLHSFMPFQVNNSIQLELMDNQLPRLASLKYLRVLSLPRYKNVKELVHDISNLTHLRYLDISFTSIKELPNSICLLFNLQTLKLQMCSHLTELPSDFHKLINLRHLDMEFSGIKKMPKYMGKLKHLQTLTYFVAGKNKGSDMKELGKLNLLNGIFSIRNLENIIDPMDAKESNMKDKKNLEKLKLGWIRNSEDSQLARGILESLQPNSNLKMLSVIGYNGTRFPDWFEAPHLPNLVSLELNGSDCCFCLPSLGELPSLRELRISRFYGIEVIGPEFYGNSSSSVPFRSLQVLHFGWMRQWEEWNVCFECESFPCLRQLDIRNCPKLRRSLPQHLPSLTWLFIQGCKNLEATLPKASSMARLSLTDCKKIWLRDVSTSLTEVDISKIDMGVDKSSMSHILLTNPYLERLYLTDCDELVSFSIGGIGYSASRLVSISFNGMSNLKLLPENMPTLFPSLHYLTLLDCPELESISQGGLPSSLVYLEIRGCPKFVTCRKDWGLHKLHSLWHFFLSDKLENVESFPEEGLLPANLKFLEICGCLNLKSINYKGLIHLQSLESLRIMDCPYLTSEGLQTEALPKSLSQIEISS